MGKENKLTPMQQSWADARMAGETYTEASRIAGYSGGESTLAAVGSRNARNAKIQAYIEEETKNDPLILTKFDRQRFWSRVVQGKELEKGEEPSMKDRIKASELLGKTQLDFVTQIAAKTESKVSVETKLDFSDLTPEQRLLLYEAIKDDDADGE